MTNFTARRNGPDFDLYANGFRFGRLADCEIAFVFQSDDEDLVQAVYDRHEPDFSFSELLAAVRSAYEAQEAYLRAEHEAEIAAEYAWVRHAERFDPEAQADLELHNSFAS